jgi:2-haloacid dehalogenase
MLQIQRPSRLREMETKMRHAAYVFDAYGTLFDVHAAVRRHAGRIGPDGQRLSDLWRAKQLEYSWLRTLMGAYVDFWQLTEQALDFALARIPTADPNLRADLLDAYWKLDCYPEVPAILKALKADGARLAILSNGSPEMLESAVRSAALDQVLDEVFSVDAVRKFKTDPAAYDLVTTSWRLYPGAVSFQSSNRWDIAGATKFGFRTVWINRAGQPDEYRDLPPSLILPTLGGLLTAG